MKPFRLAVTVVALAVFSLPSPQGIAAGAPGQDAPFITAELIFLSSTGTTTPR